MKGRSRTDWHLSMQGPQTCKEAEDSSSLASDVGTIMS